MDGQEQKVKTITLKNMYNEQLERANGTCGRRFEETYLKWKVQPCLDWKSLLYWIMSKFRSPYSFIRKFYASSGNVWVEGACSTVMENNFLNICITLQLCTHNRVKFCYIVWDWNRICKNQIVIHSSLWLCTFEMKQYDSCQDKWLIPVEKSSYIISASNKPADWRKVMLTT